MSDSIQEGVPKPAEDSTETDIMHSMNEDGDTCVCQLIFEFPEKCMRRIFRTITINICKYPLIYLLGYLALLSVVVVASFTLVRPESVAVFDAYQPQLYRQRADLSTRIDKNWNQFLNKSSQKVTIDKFRVLFYDIQLKNTTEKMNLFKGVKDICQYVQKFNFTLPDNFTLSLETIQQQVSGKNENIPKLCQLVEKANPYLHLAEQAGFLESLTSFLSPEILKKHLGEELEDVGSAPYVSALPPIIFIVERSKRSEEWQLQLLDALIQFRKVLEAHVDFKVTFSTSAYMRSEEMMVLNTEMPKLVISIAILVVTTLAVCINYTSFIYSKALMAIAAVVMSVLAVLTGLAVGNICGFKWLSLLAFVPFLIIGIGLDSAFLLVHQWLLSIRSGRHRNATALMVETVNGCFLSVTLSDFTAIGAFGVGAITPFQAVNLCCVYLALCVVFLWLTELFFFLPCLTIKSIRVFKSEDCSLKRLILEVEKEPDNESKMEWKESVANGKNCGINSPERTTDRSEEKQQSLSCMEKLLSSSTSANSTESLAKKQCNIMFETGNFFNTYEKIIMKLVVFTTSREIFRISWVLIFVCISVSAVYNISVMKPYEANDKYYDDNSVTREYYLALRDYALWKSVGSQIILPEPRPFDRFWISRISDLQSELQNEEIFSNFDWLNCYLIFTEDLQFGEEVLQIYSRTGNFRKTKEYNEICANSNQHGSSQYNEKVNKLLRNCKNGVAYSIQWEEVFCGTKGDENVHPPAENNNKLPDHVNFTVVKILSLDYISIKFSRKMVQMGDTEKECPLMDVFTNLENKFSDLGIAFYDWSITLMWRNCLMVASLWRSVAIAGSCCLAMVTVFIPHLLLIVTILLMTGLTFLHILGTMSLIGLTYCTQTYVVSLIAMGMCIDYVAHSGRCFFNAHRVTKSDLPAVLAKTMTEISVPLTNSALTTIAGISLLMFANSEMFREIGYAVVAIFAHSYLNGCFILPVLLFYISRLNEFVFNSPGPDNSNSSMSRKIDKLQNLPRADVESTEADMLNELRSKSNDKPKKTLIDEFV